MAVAWEVPWNSCHGLEKAVVVDGFLYVGIRQSISKRSALRAQIKYLSLPDTFILCSDVCMRQQYSSYVCSRFAIYGLSAGLWIVQFCSLPCPFGNAGQTTSSFSCRFVNWLAWSYDRLVVLFFDVIGHTTEYLRLRFCFASGFPTILWLRPSGIWTAALCQIGLIVFCVSTVVFLFMHF